ncbi:nickel ABC transporter ATP-binding protein NikE [Amnibacterium flavum]|uniref:Microcin ABC transporter ATP-binding protein n=1 Tax=Amnibacterium flavum TaxID=2173173 RepID=A0A2V1HSR9_9MICO|nr:ABC transporter ATP-binding protein [Amnibacterium flavum]PVZ95381.1 microcin ABC transporter ATP-binding protein [Amnibacterium flavum]
MTGPILAVSGLSLRSGPDRTVVSDVSFEVAAGESLGLVGESGSGKSLTLRAILGVLPVGITRTGGSIVTPARVAMIFQEPLSAMSPSMRAGELVAEAVRASNRRMPLAAARRRALELLGEVGIADPERVRTRYPHQLSGGLRQRVMIAAALATDPEVLLCDEPTTALDVTIQAQIMDLLDRLRTERGMAMVFVSHDLAVVAALCQRIAVMKEGRIVESGPTAEIVAHPTAPYSIELVRSARAKAGAIRDAAAETPSEDWLVVDDLTVRFPGARRRDTVTAVDAVSFRVPRGGSVGIVGESGSGKSTIARAMVGLVRPGSGGILLDGRPYRATSRGEARRIQMVFQDPMSSLNPRRRIRSVLTEVLRAHGARSAAELETRVIELMDMVRLPHDLLDRFPRSLSGGQRQRVSIARALAVEPDVVILDESIAALDVSVQAQVLALLNDLKQSLGLTLLFISHDLGAVRALCDEVVVMSRGRIVERGMVDEVLRNPSHPYTRLLIESEPELPAVSGV